MSVAPLQILLLVFAGWVNRHQAEAVAYLQEENRELIAKKDDGTVHGFLRGKRYLIHDRDPFALETAMDELAYALAIDPVELRIRNHVARDEQHDPHQLVARVPLMTS